MVQTTHYKMSRDNSYTSLKFKACILTYLSTSTRKVVQSLSGPESCWVLFLCIRLVAKWTNGKHAAKSQLGKDLWKHSLVQEHRHKNTVPEGRWHGLCIIITHYRERMEWKGEVGPGGVVCMSWGDSHVSSVFIKRNTHTHTHTKY